MTIARTAFGAIPRPLIDELSVAGLDPYLVYEMVQNAFDEDLPRGGVDVTSEAMPDMGSGTADFVAREPGVVAGLAVAELAFRYAMDDAVGSVARIPDGARVVAGERVLTVSGPLKQLLVAERTALNFASHLSGVATATATWVAALEGTGTRVLDTRKTLPTYRSLQKYAVRCAGGVNHRLNLSERAIVRDNHVLAAGGVVPAYKAVRVAFPELRVEVEVTDLQELADLLAAGCTEIVLDNMDQSTIAEAVRITAGRAILEASGTVAFEQARQIAETGVDFISVGALTHSVKVFDLGMDLRGSS